MPLKISEYLQMTDDSSRMIQCKKCSHNFCSVNENYKLFVAMKEESVKAANPENFDSQHFVDKDIVFRRYFCPNCAVQLETEVNIKGEDPIWDIKIIVNE